MASKEKFNADIGLKTDADLQVDGNVTVTGDFTVNGTSTTINATTTSVEDNMLELANSNTSSDTIDIGIYGNYDDGLSDAGASEYTGLFRDASDSTWKLFDGLEEAPTTTVNTSGTGYTLADLQVGDLTATTLTATNSLTGASISYPTTDGTNGQVLKTDGSGTLSFGDIPAGYSDSDVETYLDGGTSTPTFASAIVDGGTGEGSLYVEGTFSGNPITARLLASDGGAVFFGSNTNHDVRIQTNGTNRMYITTDGTMGFGMSPLGTNNGSAFFDGNVSSKDGFMTTASDLQLIQPSAGNSIFVRDNGNESMRISSSGCVGVGSTVDRSLGTNIGTLVVNGSAGGGLWLSPSDSSAMSSKIYAQANGSVGDLIINNGTGVGSGGIRIQTNETERWRIDSAGRMTNAFDAVNSSILQVAGNSVSGGVVNFIDPDVSVATSNHILRCTFSVDTDSQGKFIAFYDAGGNIGSVSQNGASSVSFNTTSDERLKENIVDASSQLNAINSIQVREFDWKSSSKHDIGMIAQELNEVIPNLVQEGGDDVTEEPWTVDYAKLTPYLVKAIQEQQTIIDDLKARIETLENA